MDDQLTRTIAHARATRDAKLEQRDNLAREVELLTARLEALEEAARMRPLRPEAVRSKGEGAHKGRQPGAISKTWREILLHVAACIEVMSVEDEGYSEEEIASAARTRLPNIRVKDVRDRMGNYEQHGYVVRAPRGGWLVTDFARKKFSEDTAPDDDLAQEDETTESDQSELNPETRITGDIASAPATDPPFDWSKPPDHVRAA